ncbi:glycosyltransferase family 4 protein [Rhizobium sp. Root482]|uniref:glycosyltransferase family 4 protein n=1 Tax=Rhizobium sp. Root482 TaxID=1736543 RepID=UPI0006FF9475|nr:glycosyltransferase family 4 protein [Rhizobium sp. Root482]KQY26674.1 hypothetical protein ASD31_00215 [Rhizobium sp. Root482]
MKVVFANRYFHPDQSATSRVVSKLAFALAARGFEVTAITSRALHDRTDVRLDRDETVSGVRIRRLETSHFGRDRIGGRALDYLIFHLAAFLWGLGNVSKGDVCVLCTDPPMLSVTGTLAMRLKGAKVVNWVLDLFPETAIELGLLRRKGVLATVSLWLRDLAFRASDAVVCPTRTMAQHVCRHVKNKARIVVVHNFSDTKEIGVVAPAENRLRRAWGLEGSFVVGYSGNFGRAHDFTTLLDAASLLRDRSDIRFLMIGSGQQHAAVVERARHLGLANMVFKPLQPSRNLAESLGAADVHIVTLLPSLEHCIVPSKFYGILAAGRPSIFIGTHQGEVAQAIAASGCGETVEIGSSVALAALIIDLSAAPERCASMAAIARQLIENDYSADQAIDRWFGILKTFERRLEPKAVSTPRKLPS